MPLQDGYGNVQGDVASPKSTYGVTSAPASTPSKPAGPSAVLTKSFKPPSRVGTPNAGSDPTASTSTPKRTMLSKFQKRDPSFKSPVTPFKSPARTNLTTTPSTDGQPGKSMLSLQNELKQKQAQEVLLKNALKILKANDPDVEDATRGDESDQHLQQLSDKWKAAGQEAARKLWDISGARDQRPSAGGGFLGGEPTAALQADKGGFGASWGWDESENEAQSATVSQGADESPRDTPAESAKTAEDAEGDTAAEASWNVSCSDPSQLWSTA